MESYKIGAGPRTTEIATFLLPLSFGISSTTLLYLLDAQLATQRARIHLPRYRLKILHVDERVLDPAAADPAHLAAVRARFPHAGEFLSHALADVYDFPDAVAALPPRAGVKDAALAALLRALPSPTSREDMAAILRTRLVVGVARREGCAGVLWGDSTTRLADKVLAEAAKGRGVSLPASIGDGPSPYGACSCPCAPG